MKSNHDSTQTCHPELEKELSLHLEKEQHLPPLAAKIYALLILEKIEALSFEEIKDFTGASKSSISNQLNFLIEEGRVDFIFKDDKRKRYFKTKRDFLKKTLELHLEETTKEIDMLSKIIRHKVDQDFNKKLVSIFRTHLENQKKHLRNLKDS
ncbi:GbsR/MarR family transcriptional regulator [Psychroflexus aurantiacus]|uniref:GbsR/MarR family transcriptional regulator n=1 Tax=Psychroflexus aurantiacus TaxID=2709310 RepID=UPI001F2170AF|nr:transcriptional regulator [Psychroflexus aurantiacus]